MKKNIVLKIVNTLVALLFTVGIVSAQSTGFMNPTDTALPHGWTNPLFGMDSDANWATAPHTSGCNCPFLYLSWNKGATYTSSELAGPFDTIDSWEHVGSPTDLWGRTAWVDTEFSNTNFRLEIANSSTLIVQGYQDFNLSVPSGATINGIVVKVLFHGNAGFTTDFLNALEVSVYYTTITGINSTRAISENIDLFPNPAHANVTIHSMGHSQLRYSIFSLDGRMVADKNEGMIDPDFSTEINLADFPRGIYIIRLSGNEETVYRKLVIQ